MVAALAADLITAVFFAIFGDASSQKIVEISDKLNRLCLKMCSNYLITKSLLEHIRK